jgi:ABC-type bacteriocin/lantibiotic exporter with double-glycine peptidase domain
MNITKQTNHNECGVCVLTSLTKFFHKNNVDKISILNQANIKDNGLSLFDFEMLAQKLGIYTEVYEMEWAEFIAHRTNDYLVLPIQIDSGLHYVIAKKNKNSLTIYDSRYAEPIYQSYEEFFKHFAKIVIFVEKFKPSFKFPITSKIDIFKNIKLSYLILSILIQVCIVALSTIGANYLNSIINNSIINTSFKNGLIITFVFLLIFILNGLTKYILKLFCARGFKQCFSYLSSNFVNSLNSKKDEFSNKVDCNNFYLIDTAIQSISNFLSYEISAFCSNIFLTIVTLTIIV